jgi:F-type H+-transporting ATPase subunit epsilon
LTVLADRAEAGEDFDLDSLASDIKDAEEDVADCTDDAQRDKLVRRLDQLRALQAALAH